MFYTVLMEKKAEGNYYSPHLSDDLRAESFHEANRRRSGRSTGGSGGALTGAVLGGGLGGIMGLGSAAGT